MENAKQWRVGRKVPLNVYAGNAPVCQCQSEEYALQIVRAVNREANEIPMENNRGRFTQFTYVELLKLSIGLGTITHGDNLHREINEELTNRLQGEIHEELTNRLLTHHICVQCGAEWVGSLVEPIHLPGCPTLHKPPSVAWEASD